MSTRYFTLSPRNNSTNFKKDLETHSNSVVHTNANFHTYTNVDYWKNCQKCPSPKPQIPKQKFNQFHTFLRTSAPFNYYPVKNGYVVYYNGGLVKEFRPLVTRQDLAKYLRTNGSLVKKTKRCFSGIKNHNFASKAYRNDCLCNFLRKSENKENIFQNECPFIGNKSVNRRFFTPNSCFTPKTKKKITYKLKKNNNKTFDGYDKNNFQNEYIKNNFNSEVNNNINNNNFIRDEMINKYDQNEKLNCNTGLVNNNDNDGMTTNKRDQILNNFNTSSYTIRPKTARRFHKVQIFNNYKPFLVDDFKEYADYE